MPKKKVKLNAKKIESWKPSTQRIQVFDADQPGLALRIAPSGKKSWSVVYWQNNRMKRYTLGSFPSVTLADARVRAKDALSRASRGDDPQEQKVTEREAGTFGQLADLYMEEHAKKEKAEKTWREDQRQLDAYVLPTWKYLKPLAIKQDDAEILLDSVAKRGPVQANRTRALLRHIFTWALQKRTRRKQFALEHNPLLFIPRATEESARDRVYSDDELKKLWKAFEAIGIVGDLFKLQLLTGVRKGELVTMEWSEVDLDAATWTQPGEKTKNGKVHLVPLSSPAVRILKGLRKTQDELKNESKKTSNYVFYSSRTGAVPMSWLQKAADRAKTESGIEDFHAHDLRRTTATRLAQAGVPDPVLKMILNHSLGKDITGVYNQYRYFDERKKALDAWAKRVVALVSGLKKVDSAQEA